MKNEKETEARSAFLTLWEKFADPLCRLFMRHNILIPEMEAILRWRGARIALEDPAFANAGRDEKYQQTFSHASVTTGLTRQEIAHAMDVDVAPVPLDGGSLHRIIRILAAWRTEEGYQDEAGQPIDLELRGGRPSLHHLCHEYGRNTPTRPIADALVRHGNAEWTDKSEGARRGRKLRFLSSVVTADVASTEGMLLIIQHGSDFLHSVQQRLEPGIHPGPRFRQGYYTDIDPEFADEAQAALHAELEKANARYAQCLEPFRSKTGGPGIRLGVGSYSFRDAPLLLEAWSSVRYWPGHDRWDSPMKPGRSMVMTTHGPRHTADAG